MSREPRERPHRLPEAAYRGRRAVSFTACEARRRSVFADSDVVAVFVEQLAEAAEHHSCVVPVYCFMPDHLHAIVMGTEAHSRPKDAMERFKQISGRWLSENRSEFEWQKDFHDHVVRTSRDWAGRSATSP